jgi:hypothetical protein
VAFLRVACAGRTARAIAAACTSSDGELGTVLFDDADDLTPDDATEIRGALMMHRPTTLVVARAGPYRTPIGVERAVLGVDVVVGLRDPARPAARLATPEPAYVLRIPQLRDRKEDLVVHVGRIARDLGQADIVFDWSFMLGLAHHDFPGDVDELEEIVKTALRDRTTLTARDLPAALDERMLELYRP